MHAKGGFMSRSVRRTSICGAICGQLRSDSEKESKMQWHRKMRAMIRQRLHCFDPDTVLLPLENEVVDVWDMGKDGKIFFDQREFPRLMRK